MTNENFEKLLEKIQKDELDIFRTKGVDYGSDDDAQACFKQIEKDVGLGPEMSIYVFSAKHLQAIKRYCNIGTVLSENIIDRIIDVRLYLAHLIAIISEKENED